MSKKKCCVLNLSLAQKLEMVFCSENCTLTYCDFKTEGLEFANILRSLEQFLYSKVTSLEQNMYFLTCYLLEVFSARK